MTGADFDALVEEARAAKAALDGFPRHYPRFLLEQAAIAGALNPEMLNDAAKAADAAAYIARRLDQLSDETERGWHGEPTPDGGLEILARCARRARGRRHRRRADRVSADARKLDRMAGDLQRAYLKAGMLKRKDETRKSARRRNCWTRSSIGAARALRCNATRAWAK